MYFKTFNYCVYDMLDCMLSAVHFMKYGIYLSCAVLVTQGVSGTLTSQSAETGSSTAMMDVDSMTSQVCIHIYWYRYFMHLITCISNNLTTE